MARAGFYSSVTPIWYRLVEDIFVDRVHEYRSTWKKWKGGYVGSLLDQHLVMRGNDFYKRVWEEIEEFRKAGTIGLFYVDGPEANDAELEFNIDGIPPTIHSDYCGKVPGREIYFDLMLGGWYYDAEPNRLVPAFSLTIYHKSTRIVLNTDCMHRILVNTTPVNGEIFRATRDFYRARCPNKK